MANCSAKEKVEQHKRKRAEIQRNHKKTMKQCAGKMYIPWQSLDEFCENSVECEDEGRMAYICSACGTLMFKVEQSKGSMAQKGTFSFCCSHGDVKIPPVKEPPSLLKDLLTGGTQRDHNFRKNIRVYNSILAFASMLLTGEEYNFKSQKQPYCYRINGQVYHQISQMLSENGKSPRFSQIYIYDKEHELDNHLNSFSTLDRILLKELQYMMADINPYAQKYNHISQVIKENPAEDV